MGTRVGILRGLMGTRVGILRGLMTIREWKGRGLMTIREWNGRGLMGIRERIRGGGSWAYASGYGGKSEAAKFNVANGQHICITQPRDLGKYLSLVMENPEIRIIFIAVPTISERFLASGSVRARFFCIIEFLCRTHHFC